MLTVSQNLKNQLSKAAQKIIDENLNEILVNIPDTNIKITLAVSNEEMRNKYKEDILDIQEYHGKEFLYIQ